MIILRDKPGQLCNRLWSYSFFIAYGLKHDIKVYIPNLKEYESLFENLDQYPKIRFRLSNNKRLEKAIRHVALTIYLFEKIKLGFIFKVLDIHFPNKNVLNDQFCCKKSIVYINSWKHTKDFDAIVKYKAEILSLFTPKKEFRDNVDTLFTALRTEYNLLVGVHIRRGDYATFKNGMYYYEDEVYRKYMLLVKSQFPDKNIGFFVSSNATINADEYLGLHIHQLLYAKGIEDLYALGLCDYIMGPPSTFSMWASYYGSVPLKILNNRNETFSINDFSIIRYQNTFENGSRYE